MTTNSDPLTPEEWESLQVAFACDPRVPFPEEFLFGLYETPSYEGHAEVLYRNGDTYYYVSGSHCSCYGLEGQWNPTAYTLDELIGQFERLEQNPSTYAYGFWAQNYKHFLPILRARRVSCQQEKTS